MPHLFALVAAGAIWACCAGVACADDPFAAAKEYIPEFYSAIRDGDLDKLRKSVRERDRPAESATYRTAQQAISIRSSVQRLVQELKRNGVDMESERVLKALPFYSVILDEEFYDQFEDARVFLGPSETIALTELHYAGYWWTVETQKTDESWKVVLDERADKRYQSSAVESVFDVAKVTLGHVETAIEQGEFERAAMILERMSYGSLSPPDDSQSSVSERE